MSDRPFTVLGIQQIAVGSLEKNSLRTLWIDLLGAESIGEYRSEIENVDEDITRLGYGPSQVEIDLMQPLDPDKSPRVHSPPLNHIGLWVDDLEAAYNWLRQQGVRFTPGGIRTGGNGYNVCFIHPKGDGSYPVGGEGVLIELVQAPETLLVKLKV